ncbi:MAG: hypothetical protein EAZ97_01910 [Bacteroidetes bacterium]|nr:MAG: hypothetical protein EAZ97_01910 [Bacteroidota bacterium]
MKLTARNVHRDLAYLYLGLIIAFSFSGIFLNHRKVWHPINYVFSEKEISLQPIENKDLINDDFIQKLTKEQQIDDKVRRFRVEGNQLKISYVNNDLSLDLTTGKGKLESYKTTPILGQMTKLHVDTSNWWIYYSDIFGIAMLVIAFTGMFIQKGEFSFRARGWKLALIGMIFPLIFLFLLA